jgi:hypothetical protein
MQSLLQWLTVLAALTSGALWWYASTINVPTKLVTAYGGPINGLSDMSAAFERQARWNSYAAIATGAAALLQAISMLIGLLPTAP